MQVHVSDLDSHKPRRFDDEAKPPFTAAADMLSYRVECQDKNNMAVYVASSLAIWCKYDKIDSCTVLVSATRCDCNTPSNDSQSGRERSGTGSLTYEIIVLNCELNS